MVQIFGKINAELQTMLKKSKTLKINISEWGIDYIEGSLELFLQKQLAKRCNDIENY